MILEALEVLYLALGSNEAQIGLLEVKKGLANRKQNHTLSALDISLVSTKYSRAIKPETVRLLIYQQEQ